MSKVVAQISTSLDGYFTGPDDGPGRGLGIGGERLQYWALGGPWTYESGPGGQAVGVDKELLDEAFATVGAMIGGRNTYDATEAWGGNNPFGIPFFVLTHRVDDAPPAETGFTFVDGFANALEQARTAAGDRNVALMGGATIRQALADGFVDELTVSVAPLLLGGGKRLFEDFEKSLELEQTRVVQSPFVTHLEYRVRR